MSYKLYNAGVSIEIELENGIYNFCDNSATGKTRMFRYLKDAPRKDKPDIVCITYDDVIDTNGECFNKLDGKFKIAFLDRADMYADKIPVDKLLKIKENSIILIDCKHESRLNIKCRHPDFVNRKERMVVGYDIFL